jgi:thioredoxin 1
LKINNLYTYYQIYDLDFLLLIHTFRAIKEDIIMATINVTDATFEEEVLKSDKPVVLDFWAPWCGPCKQIGPSLEEISDEMKDKITVAKINIDENPVSPTKYGVRGIPTMLVFKNGEAAAQKVGAVSKPAIVEWIEDSLA